MAGAYTRTKPFASWMGMKGKKKEQRSPDLLQGPISIDWKTCH
jgi:hypothetical protein